MLRAAAEGGTEVFEGLDCGLLPHAVAKPRNDNTIINVTDCGRWFGRACVFCAGLGRNIPCTSRMGFESSWRDSRGFSFGFGLVPRVNPITNRPGKRYSDLRALVLGTCKVPHRGTCIPHITIALRKQVDDAASGASTLNRLPRFYRANPVFGSLKTTKSVIFWPGKQRTKQPFAKTAKWRYPCTSVVRIAGV